VWSHNIYWSASLWGRKQSHSMQTKRWMQDPMGGPWHITLTNLVRPKLHDSVKNQSVKNSLTRYWILFHLRGKMVVFCSSNVVEMDSSLLEMSRWQWLNHTLRVSFNTSLVNQESLLLCLLIWTMILVILNDKSEMKHFVCLIPQILWLWLWHNSHQALALNSWYFWGTKSETKLP
jgi:hypothetical protein